MAIVDKAHLDVALRVREIELEGALKGHKMKARPPTGYEKNVLVDRARTGNFTDGLIFMYCRMIKEWDLRNEEGETLPIEREVFEDKLSSGAFDAIQDALDPFLAELDEKMTRFLDGASETSPEGPPNSH